MIKCPKCSCDKIMGEIKKANKHQRSYWIEINMSMQNEPKKFPAYNIDEYQCFNYQCRHKWPIRGEFHE